MSRTSVSTSLDITDTGWVDTGPVGTQTASVIPEMTAETTNRVKITANSFNTPNNPWRAADRDNSTRWHDTGGGSSVPSWWNVDFDTGGVSGNFIAVKEYSIRAGASAGFVDNAPRSWRLLAGNYDTGTYATDTGKWTLEDQLTNRQGWGVSEKRLFTVDGADTGTVEARRHWRLYFTSVDTGNPGGDASGAVAIAEIEMFTDAGVPQQFILNASARGS